MSDWQWKPHPDDLLNDLPPEARAQLDQLAREITVRDSMVYILSGRVDGASVGPGLRTETRDKLMIAQLTDIRGERLVIPQISWFS